MGNELNMFSKTLVSLSTSRWAGVGTGRSPSIINKPTVSCNSRYYMIKIIDHGNESLKANARKISLSFSFVFYSNSFQFDFNWFRVIGVLF